MGYSVRVLLAMTFLQSWQHPFIYLDAALIREKTVIEQMKMTTVLGHTALIKFRQTSKHAKKRSSVGSFLSTLDWEATQNVCANSTER